MKQFNPPKQFREYISGLLVLFQGHLYLQEYLIRTKYVNRISDRRYPQGMDAQVENDPVYLDIKVYISKAMYKKWRDKDYRLIAQNICHELVHTLTDPYYETLFESEHRDDLKDLITKYNERQTERITNAIMSFVRPEHYLPK